MSVYKTELGSIHYFYKKAKENQKTIVFLPSFGGDSTYFNFKNIIDKLNHQYGYLAIDTIGYGESIEQDMNRNISNIIQNYLDIINYLKLKNIVLFGHSMGAIYSLFLSQKKLDIKSIFLIEPPHIDIKDAVLNEDENFIEQVKNIKTMIVKGDVIPTDFLESTNPNNTLEERTLNSQILFNGFGNESILSESKNTVETIDESAKILSDSLLANITLLCTDAREEEYNNSQFKNVKDIFALKGSHYLHWSNEKEVLKILFNVI
ncbi:alpha/beta hydrolase [Vagococcus vulneris]|uniref:AB hydrolase-1 domain-containing protein n=1 Tax=Vagococcus vulneris TaxID=1977869 RepID=A0A429ZXF1_9ENTE|nr:alpha/beta hydrolase [Vagococcus vulneris]RST98530.1 hypothetical protein CBF37_07075 [Vagococcus vulneris]